MSQEAIIQAYANAAQRMLDWTVRIPVLPRDPRTVSMHVAPRDTGALRRTLAARLEGTGTRRNIVLGSIGRLKGKGKNKAGPGLCCNGFAKKQTTQYYRKYGHKKRD